MIRGIHHITIATKDLDGLTRFYRELLGFEVAFEGGWPVGTKAVDMVTGLDNTAGRFAMLRLGNACLEMFEFRSPVPGPVNRGRRVCDPGFTHLCLDVVDIDAEYQRLSAAGMVFHCPPRVGAPGVTSTYGLDPDGNVIEIQELGTNALIPQWSDLAGSGQ
ncbi:VOC family protein [Nocardia sp. NPDC051052]|uniref:VOC family protein n=1 Tax=Nocardia sp. NPDC051052 TaxID=3364322 RepID=UPI00378C42D7